MRMGRTAFAHGIYELSVSLFVFETKLFKFIDVPKHNLGRSGFQGRRLTNEDGAGSRQ